MVKSPSEIRAAPSAPEPIKAKPKDSELSDQEKRIAGEPINENKANSKDSSKSQSSGGGGSSINRLYIIIVAVVLVSVTLIVVVFVVYNKTSLIRSQSSESVSGRPKIYTKVATDPANVA